MADLRLVALAVAVLLGACGAETPVEDGQAAVNVPAAAPAAKVGAAAEVGAAKAAEPVLTSGGWGPLRIGMSRAEVVAALGEDRNPEAVGGPDPESCDEFYPARAPQGLLVMIEQDRLTRISLVGASRVKTDRGLGLGATAAAVRAAYGPELRAEPHKYEEAPAEYLTAWTRDAPSDERSETPASARGVRYEVGAKGAVQAIIAGGPSIRYVEGCA